MTRKGNIKRKNSIFAACIDIDIKKIMMKRYVLFLTALMLYASIFAQIDSIPEVQIPEVTIHENRNELLFSKRQSGILIISSDHINNLPVQSVADLLHYSAGVDMRQRGSNGVQSDVSIRGGSFDQVLVLINGIRINDPQTGHHSFNLPVDLSNVERIEVYKGPSARVFGQDAFAGAINIITKNPDDKYIQLQLIGGDFGLAGGGSSVSLPCGSIKNYLSANHERSSGFRYNTDYKITNVFYQSEITTAAGMINLSGGYSDRRFGANGFYSGPENKDQYESVITSLAAIGFSPSLKNRLLKINTRFYWRRNRDEYLFIRHDPSFYRNLHINNNLGLDLKLSFYNSLGVTDIGIDMNLPWITSNRLGNRSRQSVALSAEHRFVLLKGDMNISTGIHFNMLSDFENCILPGVDIGYSLCQSLMVFANCGYTYRIPTYTDLYYEDPVNSCNPDLQPEYAFSIETGLKIIKITGISGQLSLFSRKGRNLIDRTKENYNDKWKPLNIREIIMNGIDFNLSVEPGKISGIDHFIISSVDLGYTYIDARNTGTEPPFSKFAMENLRNHIVTGVVIQYPFSIYQSINLRYTDRVRMNNHAIFDTRVGWTSDKFKIYIDLTNIFNKEYMEANFVTLPGRWIKVGATYKFPLK